MKLNRKVIFVAFILTISIVWIPVSASPVEKATFTTCTGKPDSSVVVTDSTIKTFISSAITSDGDNASLNCLDTSTVTNMSQLFATRPLFNGDISAWETGSVTNMSSMFKDSTAFNGDLSSWDTHSVTNMSYMFNGATAFNGDISSWDTHSVTNMSSMFKGAIAFSGDISSWDVSFVKDMSFMFSGATAMNNDLSGWDTSSLVFMNQMFQDTTFSGNLENFDVSHVTNFRQTFFNATGNFSGLENWDTSSATNMYFMFSESTFNGDISGWNTSSVTTMNNMFSNMEFNGDISGWNTSAVEDMSYMFNNNTSFNQDLSGWDTSSVQTLTSMFKGAISFNQDISTWDFSSLFNGNASSMLADSGMSAKNVDNLVLALPDMTSYKFNNAFTGLEYSHISSERYNVLDDIQKFDGKLFEGDLVTRDLTLNVGDTWIPSDSFVSMTVASGYSVDEMYVSQTNNVNMNAVGQYTVTFQSAFMSEPVTANVDVVEPVPVDTNIEKFVINDNGSSEVNSSEILNYEIVVVNPDQNLSSYRVTIRDSLLENLPAYIVYNGDMVVTGSTYSGDLIDGSLVLDKIPAQGTVTINYSLTVNDIPEGVSTIENIVTDNGQDPLTCADEDKLIDCDVASIIVPEIAETNIEKFVINDNGSSEVNSNEILNYEIVVENPNSNTSSLDVQIRDSLLENLPAYILYNGDMVITGSTYSGDMIDGSLVLDEVPAQGTVTINYSLTVNDIPEDVSTIENIVTDNGQSPLTCAAEVQLIDCDVASIIVPEIVNPEIAETNIEKFVINDNGSSEVKSNEVLNYEIVVENLNPNISSLDVQIRDSLLENLPAYILYNGDLVVTGSTYSGDIINGSLVLDEVPAQETVTINYSLTVNDIPEGVSTIENIVSDNGQDPLTCAAEDQIIDCDVASIIVSEIVDPEVPEIVDPEVPEIVDPEVPEIVDPEVPEIIDPEVPEIVDPEVPVIIEPEETFDDNDVNQNPNSVKNDKEDEKILTTGMSSLIYLILIVVLIILLISKKYLNENDRN